MNKYIFGMAAVLAGFAAFPAFAQTPDDYGIAAPGAYCPTLSITMQRGARDISTNNQVSELQKFLADYYNFDPVELVTGYFGRITQGYVTQFQREQGLPTFGIAGQLTRAAIATVCSQTPSVQTNTQSNSTTSNIAGCTSGGPFNSMTGRPCPSVTTTVPTCSLSASPGTVTAGGNVTFSWTSQNATYATWQQDYAANILGLSADKMPPSDASLTITTSGFTSSSISPTLLVYSASGVQGWCSKTITTSGVSTAQPSATIDQNSLSSSGAVHLTGTASNINNSYANNIEVDVLPAPGSTGSGGAGGYATVTNGLWRWPVSSVTLPSGTYTVQVIDPGNRKVLATGTLTVTAGTNTPSATIDQNSLTASTGGKDAAAVTLSGSATNVSRIGISVDQADGGPGATSAIVSGGRWTVTIPSVFPGTHSVTVLDSDTGYSYGHLLTTGTLTVSDSITLDQSSVTASGNTFTISGTANSNSVFVALVKSSYTGSQDWHTIYTNHSYVAFTGDSIINTVNTHWTASFSGVSSGTYKVLVYDNSSTQALLGTGTLSVSVPSTISYVAGSQTPLTLGVGQTATDGGAQITLNSVYYSNGTTGTPMANIQVDIKGYSSNFYTVAIGGLIPSNGGGLTDAASPTGGISISVSAISVAMNTATILISTMFKG